MTDSPPSTTDVERIRCVFVKTAAYTGGHAGDPLNAPARVNQTNAALVDGLRLRAVHVTALTDEGFAMNADFTLQ